MKRFVTLVAGFTLAVGLVVGPADQASAHNFDNYSLWSCAYAGRPSSYWNIDHSGPTRIWDGLVEYGCCMHSTLTGAQLGTRVKRDTNTGAIYRDDELHVPPYPFPCY